jgi:uncharacterized YigZ family protein
MPSEAGAGPDGCRTRAAFAVRTAFCRAQSLRYARPYADDVATPVHSDLLVKKSRFIGCVQAVPDRAAALAVVAGLRAQHPAASHVCWALLAGGQSAANDDGEPGGTAGRPMLEVLRRQDLEGVLATVVRYFGGVKLGAGGLVRAYTDAVAQALLTATKLPVERMRVLRCAAPYAMEGVIRRELVRADALLGDVRHQLTVEIQFTVAEAKAAAVVALLNDAGDGTLQCWTDFAPAQPTGAAASQGQDVLAVEQLFHLGGGISHFGHGSS